VTSRTPSPWKASLYHAAPKIAAPCLPANWLQNCMHETAEGTSEYHAPPVAPLPPPPQPQENNPAQTLGRLKHPPSAKLKNINSEL
jgi:hypothetical protein